MGLKCPLRVESRIHQVIPGDNRLRWAWLSDNHTDKHTHKFVPDAIHNPSWTCQKEDGWTHSSKSTLTTEKNKPILQIDFRFISIPSGQVLPCRYVDTHSITLWNGACRPIKQSSRMRSDRHKISMTKSNMCCCPTWLWCEFEMRYLQWEWTTLPTIIIAFVASQKCFVAKHRKQSASHLKRMRTTMRLRRFNATKQQQTSSKSSESTPLMRSQNALLPLIRWAIFNQTTKSP